MQHAEKSEKQPLNGGYNAELEPDIRKPRQVLQDLMLFYDKQAKDIIADIILRLKNESTRATGSELALMYKKFSECADRAIECATKLAPYEHPKLESIEVKKELTHRFVIRAPAVQVDNSAWLAKAQEEQKYLLATPGHNLVDVTPEEKPKVTFEEATKEAKPQKFEKSMLEALAGVSEDFDLDDIEDEDI